MGLTVFKKGCNIYNLTHLSNGPRSVGIHSWVGTPCKGKLSRNLFFFMLSVSPGVNRLDVNALKDNREY